MSESNDALADASAVVLSERTRFEKDIVMVASTTDKTVLRSIFEFVLNERSRAEDKSSTKKGTPLSISVSARVFGSYLTPRVDCQNSQYSSFGIEILAKPTSIDIEFDIELTEAVTNIERARI
jgi:hypothetical protein